MENIRKQSFGPGASGLGFQPPLFGRAGRSGRPARFGPDSGHGHQMRQTLKGLPAITFLSTVGFRAQHQFLAGCDAFSGQSQQPRPAISRETRVAFDSRFGFYYF